VSSPRVLHLSTYNAHGGAARAALAVHTSLKAAGVKSEMRIAKADSLKFKLAKEADCRIWALQKSNTLTWRSPAKFGSITAKEINNSGVDIVHLHWVTDGFLTIETIGKINKPIVWSLCDAWAFSGAEHYATEFSRSRSQQGYQKFNRNPSDTGLDVDRWTWNRKRNNWRRPMQLLPASSWLTEATRESVLLGAWPITQIPHIVDTNVFTPQPQDAKTTPILLFLASAGIHDQRKGWDLLEESLNDPALATRVHVIVVGPKPTELEQQKIKENSRHQITFYGEARGDQELVDLYAQADITVVPSREDNMPITAMESQSCGTPVVAFRIGGLPDIVDPVTSGYLADPEDPHDLAYGIEQVLQRNLRESTRAHALATWSPDVVVPQLLDIYSEALKQ